MSLQTKKIFNIGGWFRFTNMPKFELRILSNGILMAEIGHRIRWV